MGFCFSFSGRLMILMANGAAFGQMPQPVHSFSSMVSLPLPSILMHSFPVLLTGHRLWM